MHTADKMKHDLYVPIVRQVALDYVHLRNGPSCQNFGEEPLFIFFVLKNLLLVVVDDSRSCQIFMINVAENIWLSVSKKSLGGIAVILSLFTLNPCLKHNIIMNRVVIEIDTRKEVIV